MWWGRRDNSPERTRGDIRRQFGGSNDRCIDAGGDHGHRGVTKRRGRIAQRDDRHGVAQRDDRN